MNSIGNDVVALALINSERTRSYRFYSKILHPAEQELYKQLPISALPFEQYVWLLWSVKESAYKYLQRLNPSLVFSPTQTVVNSIETNPDETGNSLSVTGKVAFKEHSLNYRSFITAEYIHSVAVQNWHATHHQVQHIEQADYEYQSAVVRVAALQRLTSYFPEQALRMVKHDAGYPELFSQNQLLPVPVSFSHHGHYIAYAFNLSSVNLH